MNLAGKTVIVTGGGRDIGRACVMELAAQGANVAINYFASSKGADSACRLPRCPTTSRQAVMDVNLTSFVLMVRACRPHMSQGASIVGLASQAGRDGGGPGASAYGAAKGALMTLTRGLAKELGPNIRVNSICPGMIDTDFHNIFTKPEVRTHVANVTPLKREGTSQEVAKLAVFLASDDAAFITGTNVDINGGTLFS